MKKILLFLFGLFFMVSGASADGGWADCAVDLKKDGGDSYLYSLGNENWADGIWILNTGFDGYSFGTPTSLVLNGGVGNGWTDDTPGYTTTSFVLHYRVYKSTATPGSWSQIALDNLYLKNANNYVYDKTNAGIDILSLATTSGTYVLEVAMSKNQFYAGGNWNSMIPGGQAIEYENTTPGYKATFTKTVSTGTPTVTGISPSSGTTAGGTSVVITGTNLTSATAVKFGSTLATITANTATSITATSPAGSAGAVDITVTTAGGTCATSASDQFTYASYNYVIANDVQVSDKILEFDLFLLNLNPTEQFELAAVQAGILINPTIYNGGIISASMITGSSQLTNIQQPTSISFNQTQNCIKLAPKTPPGSGSGSILSTTAPGTKVCRIRLTNTLPFASGTKANLTFSFSNTTYATKVYQYLNGVNTQLTSDATNCFSIATNAPLNKPITAQTVTGSGSYCPGTGGLAVGLASSESGITYTLCKDGTATATTVAGTGSAVSFPAQTAGTYSVKASYVNGVYVWGTIDMTGSAVVVENPTLTAGVSIAADANNVYSGTLVTFTATPTNGGTTPDYQWYMGTTAVGTNSATYSYAPANGDVIKVVMTSNATPCLVGSPVESNTVTINLKPTITNISPTSGSTAVGTSVVISGTNLTSANAVKFGSTLATITANTATSITATSPAGSAGSVHVTVTTAVGTSATSASDQFTYIAAPTAITNAATSVTSTDATLNGNINANSASTTVTFEYGLTTSYGTSVTATPSPVTGSSATSVSAAISGLTPNTLYHYKVKGVNGGGTTNGDDLTLTTESGQNLLDNPGAELDYTSWTKTDGGSGWGIEGSAYSGSRDWASSYQICTLSQTVDLIAKGYEATDLDLSIPIYAKAYVATNSFSGGQATVKVELLNASDGVISTYYVCNENLATNLPWTKKETLISGYSTGLRKIRYTISGSDNIGWAGQYGPRFDETEVSFKKVTTNAATLITKNSATLNSTVFTLGLSSTVKFEYGITSGVYTNDINVSDISGTSANVNLTGLNQGTTYYARAVMTNSSGTFSGEEISFKTKIQLTISDPVIASKSYNGNINATVSTLGILSGIDGSDEVSVSPTASFDNANAGTGKTITISYSLSGANMSNYLAPVNTVLNNKEITKAVLTSTADNKTKVYGAINPTLTFQYSGWVNGTETIDTPPTIATTVDGTSVVGTYADAIALSGGTDNNYTFSLVSGDFEVTKAVLTVIADNQTKVYGAINPTLTFQYSGWANGTETIDTPPTIATTVDGTSVVGTYADAITLSGGTDNNYTFSLVSGDFEVTRAELTVIADNQTKVYGAINPTLTFQYSGWVNGTETIDTPPTIATTVDGTSVVGTYADAIALSGGTDNNYTFSLVSGDFEVTKAVLTATADNQTKVYGATNPTLVFQYSGWVNGTETIDTPPTISTTVDGTSVVGTYANSITLSGGTDNNYTFSLVSGDFEVTKAVLTATADDQTKVYGSTNPTLVFQYSGWVNGTETIDTPPTISTTVDGTSVVGTYANSITLAGGTDNNYTFSLVSGDFEVTKAVLTATADSKIKVYGSANPTLVFQYSGWVNGTETIDTQPTITTTVDGTSVVGTYANSITLSGGIDNNYTFSLVSGDFEVTKAVLTATADNQTKVYGAANPTLTFQYTGWVNGVETIGTPPTISTTVTGSSDVDTYADAITLSGGTDNNYTFSLVSGDFEVTKAVLTVTADSKIKVYGAANPVLTFKYIGWVNNEEESVLDTKPTVTTTVNVGTTAGTYLNSITVSGGADNNYDFTYVQADFEVSKAILTVKAFNKTKVYGATMPVLTYEYSGWLNGVDEIDTPPIISSTVDIYTEVGNYSGAITVSGAVDDKYSFVYLPGDFEVTKSILTVTANNKTKEYGNENPTLTYLFTGWVKGIEEIDVPPTIFTTVDKSTPAGTHNGAISFLGGEDNNFTFKFEPASFSISKAKLDVVADNQTKVYGEENPILTYSCIGWKNNDNISDLLVQPIAGTLIGKATKVGKYTDAITVSGGFDENYEFSYVSSDLKVTKASLVVVAESKAKCFDGKVFGGKNNVTYSGFVNGEDRSVLGGILSFKGSFITATNVGAYTIVPEGLSSENYQIIYQDGLLTINPLPTATLSGDLVICAGSYAILEVKLTGLAPWSITVSDGITSRIIDSIYENPYRLEVTGVPNSSKTYTIAKVTDSNGCSNEVEDKAVVKVNPLVTSGEISGDQHVASGVFPRPITSLNPGQGIGTITYAWESSVDDGLNWEIVPDASEATFAPGIPDEPIWFRRVIISSDNNVLCSEVTEPVKISIWPTAINTQENNSDLLIAYAVKNIEMRLKGEIGKLASARLYDVQGRLILVKNLEEGSFNIIPTPYLKTGIYMLFVEDSGTIKGFKIPVKE